MGDSDKTQGGRIFGKTKEAFRASKVQVGNAINTKNEFGIILRLVDEKGKEQFIFIRQDIALPMIDAMLDALKANT